MKIEMAVIIMSEKIFILCQDDLGNYEIRYDDKIFHFLWEVAPILNEQQITIQRLKEENEELKRKLEYCEHEHFLDSLSGSNKWFGMGGF